MEEYFEVPQPLVIEENYECVASEGDVRVTIVYKRRGSGPWKLKSIRLVNMATTQMREHQSPFVEEIPAEVVELVEKFKPQL